MSLHKTMLLCGLLAGAMPGARSTCVQSTKVELPVGQPAIAPYLKNEPRNLYVYANTDRPISEWTLVDAPAADMQTARSYALSPNKGRARAGYRATILTAKTHYMVGEAVRVIHVLDVTHPGARVYVMGPKEIVNEYVDGRRASPGPPDSYMYGGMVLPAPCADFNYQISVYHFAKPALHTIQWRGAGFYEGQKDLRSNTLHILVAPASPPSF